MAVTAPTPGSTSPGYTPTYPYGLNPIGSTSAPQPVSKGTQTHGTGKGTSSTTSTVKLPGSATAQSGKSGLRILSDLDGLMNAKGLAVLNPLDDAKVILVRAAVIGAGFVLGIAGVALITSALWGKTPAPVKDAAEATGGAAVASTALAV